MALHLPRKEIQLHSIALSLADVERIFTRLTELLNDQATVELNALVRKPEHTVEQFEAQKERLREEVFRITVRIHGEDGASLHGDDISVFRSPNRPNRVRSIYVTNTIAYELATNRKPINSFTLFLDFSKPPLLDSQNPVSSPTPNESNLAATGERDAWVAAVVNAVDGVIKDRRTRRTWIHRGFVYDGGVLVLGIPFGFYACWKLADVVAKYAGAHSILEAAAYVYVFFLGLWVYRILFGYTRWAFPTVELNDNPDTSRTHRGVWLVIVLGLVVNAIWELARFG